MKSLELRKIAILFNRLSYSDFCLAIDHSEDDWSLDKFQLFKSDFMEFIARVDDDFIQQIMDFCSAKMVVSYEKYQTN